ncbi:uncharacterized protein LOC131077095 isoform X1 [Cryptomeria japonica]|uniref:uncharacterized protein LOC131077095 isoform X1 n=1 Tax=Cryptomeria japonica TaxID=3369 RepID=UPI0025AC8D38|nr:uncharacterized protein LOC131077095 isoform X1 [Cryptomeria japonica]
MDIDGVDFNNPTPPSAALDSSHASSSVSKSFKAALEGPRLETPTNAHFNAISSRDAETNSSGEDVCGYGIFSRPSSKFRCKSSSIHFNLHLVVSWNPCQCKKLLKHRSPLISPWAGTRKRKIKKLTNEKSGKFNGGMIPIVLHPL